MKSYFILMVYLFLFVWLTGQSIAQSDITFSVQKEEIEKEDWIKIFITNNSAEDIHLISGARWDPQGYSHDYLSYPSSFIQFIGNPNDSIKTYKTGKIILSKNDIDYEYGKIPPFVIRTGETYTEVYKLFGEEYFPIRTFIESYKSKLKDLQVKLQLRYFHDGKEGVLEEIILSNVLEYEPDSP